MERPIDFLIHSSICLSVYIYLDTYLPNQGRWKCLEVGGGQRN